MTEAILRLEGIAKSFGGLKVIDDVSFDVRRGSRTALIGPNGAGKTTVFNLISGAYEVDGGAIHLGEEDITGLPARLRIGRGVARSFQNVRLMPHLSTVENVMLGENWRSSPLELVRGRRAGERAAMALANAGLDTYPGQVVSTLPYGIQKRIEVVRALAAEPKLLLLDEPTEGIQPNVIQQIGAVLQRLVKERGMTIVMVEQYLDFVKEIGDRFYLMDRRRVVASGLTSDLNTDLIHRHLSV